MRLPGPPPLSWPLNCGTLALAQSSAAELGPRNPKVVQELLGHSQFWVTMDVYSHALPTMQRDAMSALNRLLTA